MSNIDLRSVGLMAETLGISVPDLRGLIREMGILPQLVLNDLNFYSVESQHRIADALRARSSPPAAENWKNQLVTKQKIET